MRFPLYARILAWFFLNLIVVGVVVTLAVGGRFGMEPFLAAMASERVKGLAAVLRAELAESNRAEWDAAIERIGGAYPVKIMLCRDDGERLAGAELELPDAVTDRLGARPLPPPGVSPPQRLRPIPGDPASGVEPPPKGPDPARAANEPAFVHTSSPRRYWAIMPSMLRLGSGPRVVPVRLVFVSETLGAGGLFVDYTPWLWAGGGVLLVSVLWWLPFVRGITRSVSRMTEASERIAEGRFDVRVPATRRDELGRLAGSVNRMAGRLDGFVTGQRRFLGDIAHELCAPIARIQIALGILEQRAQEKQRDGLADLREEVQQMSGLVNELLSFSKAGLRQQSVPLQSVLLGDVVPRVVAREDVGAGQVQMDVPPDLRALAEPELLARAVANLVRNALRYAGEAGPITVSARAEGQHVVLRVTDSGPGVPAEALERIFDPFFRVEASRSRDTGGVGLGLAIVKTCVEACQGTVTATNGRPAGLQVEIRLRAG
jgi:two-component system sensor histidine kinase CpxA